MAKKTEEGGWDSPENEVASSWVKFNVPFLDEDGGQNPAADKILGTLVAKKKVKSTLQGKEGTDAMVYELKGDEGSYHTLDERKKVVEPAVRVESGAFYSVGGTVVIDRQMQNVRVGQKVGLKYIEEKPSKTKGFAPAKIVKVYTPKDADGNPLMDEEFLKQAELDSFGL